MHRFFRQVLNKTLSTTGLVGTSLTLNYLIAKKMEKQRKQLAKENPGKNLESKITYIPGVGPYYHWEVSEKDNEETSNQPKNP